MCPNSGKINSFKANFTALGDPGSKKTALFLIFPAVALDNIAADPISLKERYRKSANRRHLSPL